MTEKDRSNNVGGYAKVKDKYVDIELNDKLRQLDLSKTKIKMGVGKKTKGKMGLGKKGKPG
ncbi:unnamed protein product [Cylicostephanus goldi]|uniref:Uncharacterized protein n=1 Tax=Cylicostephanus goldi TaxID=71465 RepID=A0A3P7MWW2_CYLGO|nr:unnamed protein product [Cylicostephanus goldi]